MCKVFMLYTCGNNMISLNKKIQMCMLADFYGNMLTEKQRKIFSRYWEEDCSLFEIAEELNITRQAVHDSLNKAETLLEDVESKCGFIKKYNESKRVLMNLYNQLDLSDEKQAKIANQILKVIDRL